MKKRSMQLWKKLVNTKKHHTYTKLLAIWAYQIYENEKENQGNESSCTKTNSLIETLTEEILVIAALEETEFEDRDESDQYSIFG